MNACYVLFFIEVGSRRVHCAGCTAHPAGEWVTQQARPVAWALAEREQPRRVLIRDQAGKFPNSFDAVFKAQGTRIIRTPVQVPEANGIAERFVRTARTECLDWLLILNTRHLEGALTVFVDHCNRHRPHRSLDLVPPNVDRRLKSGPAGTRWRLNVAIRHAQAFALFQTFGGRGAGLTLGPGGSTGRRILEPEP